MIDNTYSGFAAARSFITATSNNCCADHSQRKANDTNDNKNDLLNDFLNELTKLLKGGQEGAGSDLVIPNKVDS